MVDSFSYRLDVSYIGSNFHGWQSQPSGNTIQDIIESKLALILQNNVRILGASRTDSGVHAEHQVASFRTPSRIDCARVKRSLQSILPEEIGVQKLTDCSMDFHPVKDAECKIYRYRLSKDIAVSPFLKPYVWQIHKNLDLPNMILASQELLGRHDFKSFSSVDTSALTFERSILDIQWLDRGSVIEFFILGDGFLKQMVRNILGTLVEVGLGKRTPNEIREILKKKDRRAAGITAPAQGLALMQIFYQPIFKIDSTWLEPGHEVGFRQYPPE